MILAACKAVIMATVAFAVTDNIIATAIISLCSAFVTGMFLLVNTYIQHKLMQNNVVERVLEGQQHMVTELKEAMPDGTEG